MTDKTARLVFFGLIGAAALILAISFSVYFARRRPNAPAAKEPVGAVVEPQEPTHPSTWQEHLIMAKDINEALKWAPLTDIHGDEAGEGNVAFVRWASHHLDWVDFMAMRPSTTFGRVQKDPDAERGARACWSGSIIEIRAIRIDFQTKAFVGGLSSSDGVIRFVAVRDTGDLEEHSQAKLCGVVTGLDDYANSAGGTTHAVHVVGMFDLPSNRAPLPTAPHG